MRLLLGRLHLRRHFVLLGRHGFFIADVRDGAEERAVFRNSGDDGRPCGAAFLQLLHRGDIEPAARLARAMAIGAMLAQQRQDVVFKIARLLGAHECGAEDREKDDAGDDAHARVDAALAAFGIQRFG